MVSEKRQLKEVIPASSASLVNNSRWVGMMCLFIATLALSLGSQAISPTAGQEINPAPEGKIMAPSKAKPVAKALIPPLDATIPSKTATATFALG